MDDQKFLKKRLKALMNRPENQVCADCPERQPRWASLIVVPPGAPAGSQAVGAFVCLECSGSHRRLGVHIAFVRSINLDSWKEKEVLAMENGGNTRVNAIFESNLPNPNIKPHNHADGPTRERFIRDKYERRKYYDPNGYTTSPVTHAPPPQRSQSAVASANGHDHGPPRRAESVGPPSDAARLRLEERRQRIKSGNVVAPERTSSGFPTNRKKNAVPKAPVSAPPPSVDLLDFGAVTDCVKNELSNQDDFFASNNAFSNQFEAPASTNVNSESVATTLGSGVSNGQRGGGGLDMFEFLTKDAKTSPASDVQQSQQKNSFGGDIMSLYSSNPTQQQSQFGNGGVPQLTSYMSGMNVGTSGDQHQAPGMFGNSATTNSNQQMMMMMMQQQQRQTQNQMMYPMNNGMMNNGGMMQGGNGMMMPGGGNNMMMPGGVNNMMMQGGGNNMMMQGMPMQSNAMQQQQSFQMPGYGAGNSGFGNSNGFGAPMGTGPPVSALSGGGQNVSKAKTQPVAEKEDPFAQFGMNVFRS